jgi:hypothetical protein
MESQKKNDTDKNNGTCEMCGKNPAKGLAALIKQA